MGVGERQKAGGRAEVVFEGTEKTGSVPRVAQSQQGNWNRGPGNQLGRGNGRGGMQAELPQGAELRVGEVRASIWGLRS